MQIGGKEVRESIGPVQSTAKSDVTVRVHGCHTMLVGAEKAPRSHVVHVEGMAQMSSSGITEIRSDRGIVLSCGRSSIRISDDKIEILAAALAASGAGGGLSIDADAIRVRAKHDAEVRAERIVLKASDASLSLAKDAKIDGGQILLNSPEQATDPTPKEPPKPTLIELVNQHGKPLAHQRFVVALADGSQVSGIVDKKGQASIELEGAGTISFPGLLGTKPA
jgi:type VI secretion system secreted protein VgrG